MIKNILKGIFIDYLGTILVVLAGFIAIPYYLTIISKVEYGLWLAINSMVMLIALSDLATDQFLTTVTSNDQKFHSEEYANYLTSILILKLGSAIVVASISSVIYIFLNSLLNLNSDLQDEAKLTLLLSIFALICGIFLNTLPTILYARHDYSLVNAYTNIFSIGSIFVVYFLLRMGYGIVAFPVALIITTMFQGLVFWVIIRLRHPQIRLNFKKFRFVEKSEIFGYLKNFQALRWLYTFRAQYISIAITNLVGSASLSQYMLTSRLAQLAPTFSAKLAQALFPTIANLLEQGDTHKVAELFTKSTKILARMAIFSGILLLLMNKTFVMIWVGEDKFAGNQTLVILILQMIIYIAMAQFAIVIFASKKFNNWVYWGCAEIVIAIISSYYFALWLGLVGVVFGFFISSLPTQIYLFREVLRQLELDALEFTKKIAIYSASSNIIPLFATISIIILEVEIRTWLALISIAVLLLILQFIFELINIIKNFKIGVENKLVEILKL